MIFAAGLGTRLKPFTLSHPKAMVRLGDKPMIERVIERLIQAGIDEIVINVHHFADEIINYVSSRHFDGVRIYISHEKEVLLDTGGGILSARKWLEDADAVLVHNADILTDVDLNRLIDAHKTSKADVTLLVAERNTSRYLYFNPADYRLEGWCDVRNGAVKPSGFIPDNDTMLCRAYAGVHVFDRNIFTPLEDYRTRVGDVFSIIPFYVETGEFLDIRGYEQVEDYHWLDIGKPESLKEADCLIKILKNNGNR